MQRYAEEALAEHLKNDLQPALDKEIKARGGRIFYDITPEQADHIIYLAMRQTQRYRGLVASGASLVVPYGVKGRHKSIALTFP